MERGNSWAAQKIQHTIENIVKRYYLQQVRKQYTVRHTLSVLCRKRLRITRLQIPSTRQTDRAQQRSIDAQYSIYIFRISCITIITTEVDSSI